MTTTINASTSSGLVNTADTSGILQLQTASTAAITIDASQNVNFSKVGQRITGDFSNATLASRVMFQTSTTNQSTLVNAIPNGTNALAEFRVFNNSDPSNASSARILVTASEATIRSDISGTGTYLPLTMYTGGSERLRIDTSGNVGINTSSPTEKLDVLGSADTTTRLRASSDTSLILNETSPNKSWKFKTSDGLLCWQYSSTAYNSGYANTMNLTTAGALILKGGSTSASGTGITFPATQSASSDANTLDDYEEGSWTPTISPTSGTVTIGTSGMRYTRIGNIVSIGGYFSVSSVSSPSGTTTMGGFPFVPFSYPGNGSNVSFTIYGTNGNLPANGVLWGYTYPGGNGAFLRITSGNGITELGNFFQAGTEFWINATYQAA